MWTWILINNHQTGGLHQRCFISNIAWGHHVQDATSVCDYYYHSDYLFTPFPACMQSKRACKLLLEASKNAKSRHSTAESQHKVFRCLLWNGMLAPQIVEKKRTICEMCFHPLLSKYYPYSVNQHEKWEKCWTLASYYFVTANMAYWLRTWCMMSDAAKMLATANTFIPSFALTYY